MPKINKLEEEYQRLYGHLPDSEEGLLRYIFEHFKIKKDKAKEAITSALERTWRCYDITLNIIPKPTPRPRASSDFKHFYVKGAHQHKKYLESIVKVENIVCSPTKVSIEVYQPIPVSVMTSTEVLLAQLGLIRPIGGGDWDNLAKTYCDMMQDILICNDNIIIEGSLKKFYSLRPHVDIHLEYLVGFDSKYNEKKVLNSKSYKNLNK